ncbi:MAG: amino acid adenylation domain-containing protein, partial [bacterium]|nr:amino acid adenylation domain-containing protein [bacterium]
PDTIVAVLVERCLEMMIGIFAIQKAGGAYLPIEPGYPPDRIDYILKDSSSRIVLTLEKFEEKLKPVHFNGEVVNLEESKLYKGDKNNLQMVNTPRDMAYIIYTSGSTGKPKGVIIEHQSLITRINWMQSRYPIGPGDVILQKTTYVFDVSVWELFWWSWYGSAQCLLRPGGEKEPAAIVEAIEKNNISTMHFVPSMLSGFLVYLDGNDDLSSGSSLKQVFASGEALTVYHVEKFNQLIHQRTKKARLINLYGPTEATVDVSYYDCPTDHTPGKVPIGKPVHNTHLLVVNGKVGLQPVEIAGELCISGDQLARGYLNRPQLTSEIFIDNPYVKDGNWGAMYNRLYKTGDLCHWLPDGNIEYLGRIDFQVKVRGFRIELGEIESQLRAIDEIKEAVVLANDDSKGEKYLCAYVVKEREIKNSKIRKTLNGKIPYYMVPSNIIPIEYLPITPNGKLDRKKLREWEAKEEAEIISADYVASTNAVEEALVKSWTDVLGRKVGIEDNFFEIGGDSIKAIQIVSKLQRQKLKLEVGQMFLHKTIRQLAPFLKSIDAEKTRKTDQKAVTGKMPLTPIQQWLFEEYPPYHGYFNQAITIFRERKKGGYEEAIIKEFFKALVTHHDALRIVYYADANNRIIQENRGDKNETLFDFEAIDLTHLDNKTHIDAKIKKESKRIQSCMDLEKGPLVKTGLFKTAAGDYLLIAIHHLVVDGISWRIMLEDFETGYKALENNTKITFQEKTDSFKLWAEKLTEYAKSKGLLKELPFWKKMEKTSIEPLPVDNNISREDRKFGNGKKEEVILDKDNTTKLLSVVNQAYNTQINDILLTALGLTVKQWAGNEKLWGDKKVEMDKVAIKMEGHGREDILNDVNISRTVGWFTSLFPVILDIKKSKDLSYSIRNVKETLRRLPNKGIGYGILKYLAPKEEKKSIDFKLNPEIVFNYLGEFKGEEFETIDGIAGITDLDFSDCWHPELPLSHKMDIEGILDNGKLKLVIFYNDREYNEPLNEDGKYLIRELAN